ncbi:hypothetical protein IEQ34_015593 [Dendrobium chrysotoxum]|uniref:Uncharacterized protein n=1 Tax=Dendrobium chrysotoxum TaxID=161865 RepID=A0AAV7GGK3_DENCH|nr:hypothetical protein IEQ34_015593 [Dendrobium chrysotoxum]
MKDKPQNTSRDSNMVCPWQEHVTYDTVRLEISKHRVKRVAEPRRSFHEVNVLVIRMNHGFILASVGEAEFGRGKRDDVEMNRFIDIGADNGGINGSSKNGDAGTTSGEDLGHVDHREHVAVRHVREEKHVEMIGFRAHSWTMAGEQDSVGLGWWEAHFVVNVFP